MTDPLVRIAHQRIVKLSADIEVQLRDMKGGAVAVEILRRLRDRAADSMAGLAVVDAHDFKAVQTLQNEVKRYDEWVGAMRDIIQEGIAYDKEMTAQDRDEMVDLLAQSPEGQREAIALGLVDESPRDA